MKDELESLKHDYETYKHLTTLSTGAIVIISTFLDKLFTNPEWKPAVVLSLVAFLISVVSSVISMFGISANMTQEEDLNEEIPIFANVVTIVSFGGFLLGVVALAVFSMKNFL